MKKIIYLASFFSLTPLLIIVVILALLSTSPNNNTNILINPEGGTVLASATNELAYFGSLSSETGTTNSLIQVDDARPLLIKNYLEKYRSPLAPYSDYIFTISQKYNLDYGLIVAIAQCESNVCKKIPPGSYNCWGFENGITRFNSWEHAIERVAVTLKERYYDYGLITPDQIMPKYAPPSVEKGGPWAKCVNQFLKELR